MKLFEENLKLFLSVIFVLIQFSSSAVLNYYRINNEPGLYSSQDDVTILTIDNFNKSDTNIYGSKRAWMVEFYSNWCGFCQRAAPRYKAFATDIKGWNDLVVVAALDCANERSAAVCEFFQITRYPTFRYIHEGYVADAKNTGLPIIADSHTNFTEHRNNLVEIMRKEQKEGRGKIFPNLQPFNDSDVTKIFSTEMLKLGFLIIQDPSDFVGPSVLMDFHKVKEIIITYSYDNETTIKTDTLPALFHVEKNGNLEPLKLVSRDREGVKIAIRDILLERNIDVPYEVLRNFTIEEDEIQEFTAKKEDLELRQKIKEMGDVVFLLDLENTLRFSLKLEVGRSGQLTGKKLEAIRKYVRVLVKYFPFGPKGKNLLTEIRKYVDSDSAINGTRIREMIVKAEEQKVFSEPKQWIGCKGSSPTKRGYPCGMWKLFHYLTVNAAFDPKNTIDSNPNVVLDAMYNYIKYFFGCEDCSNHFQEMAERREIFNVLSWEESVLWLWRAHNEVNKRLSGDTSEDPEYPKMQFPTKLGCPNCKKNDGTWDEIEILNFLKKMYISENIKYFGINPEVSHLDNPIFHDNPSSVAKRIIGTKSVVFSLSGIMISLIFTAGV